MVMIPGFMPMNRICSISFPCHPTMAGVYIIILTIHQDFSRLIRHTGPRHFMISGWLKWGQTFYPGSATIGSGLDEIPGNRKSEIKAQVLVQWR